jgi:tRNA pseudouridine32 synthase/23S rRNA pseudouridine746 synthase
MTRPRPAWTPPTRDGVGASRVAVAAGPWGTVLAFLRARLPAVADWPERLARGDVLDAQGRAVGARDAVVPGQLLWYWRSLPAEPRVPFELEVLHRDDELLVVDKPHFLPVAPSGRYLQETVLVRLKRQLGLDELVALHRLDRETAGVLLFSLRPQSRNAYHALWRQRQVHKVYEAVAPWRAGLALPATVSHRLEEPADERFMQMQVRPGEPNAHTRVELLRRLGPARAGPLVEAPLALYRLQPLTGRRHQLRAQMNALGLPIVGDRIYPVLWPEPAADAAPDWRQPLQLLARAIAFTDPVTGQHRQFTSRRRLERAGDPF